MMDILKEIVGAGLVVLGVVMMQFTCRYGALIWKKEAPINFSVLFYHLGAFFLVFFGLRLCGVTFLSAFFFWAVLIYMISWIIQGIAINWFEMSKTEKVLGIPLGLLIIATFIFGYWFYCIRTKPGEQRLDKYVEDVLFGTSTKTIERNESR